MKDTNLSESYIQMLKRSFLVVGYFHMNADHLQFGNPTQQRKGFVETEGEHIEH